MRPTTIFITYNPDNAEERTLATRLHTIGAVNGFRMFLPDRFNSDSYLDAKTQIRISESDYFIMFSLSSKFSNIVWEEINYASHHFKDYSKIIIIQQYEGSKPPPVISNKYTQFFFDPSTQHIDDIAPQILGTIKQKESKITQGKAVENALLALLGIGLGLLILNELTSND